MAKRYNQRMSFFNVLILAIVQGLAELLPVSSSAHVVVAEKLLGLDPASPQMTLLLVMLHTGTMFAVIVYFWQTWRDTYFVNVQTFVAIASRLLLASVLTAVIGEALVKLIEGTAFHGVPVAEIEDLFGHLELIAPALAAGGVLILIAGLYERRRAPSAAPETRVGFGQASLIGAVQGLCLPFRGLSRSGATISTGMLAGVGKARAESFSFALAVILTPAAVGRETLRLVHAAHGGAVSDLKSVTTLCVIGAVIAFAAGLLALRWLSRWLEQGRWYLFGVYCLVAAGVVGALHYAGY